LAASGVPLPVLLIFMGFTALLSVIAWMKRSGAGMAPLFSALVSSGALALDAGYIPYVTGFQIGYMPRAWLLPLGLAISASLLGYLVGQADDLINRLAVSMKGYGKEDLQELSSLGTFVGGVGLALIALSLAVYELLLVQRVSLGLSPILALGLFLVGYEVLVRLGGGKARW